MESYWKQQLVYFPSGNYMLIVINRCPEKEYFISRFRIGWRESSKLRLSALHNGKRKTITKRNYNQPSTVAFTSHMV